jgi:hypothetical protein
MNRFSLYTLLATLFLGGSVASAQQKDQKKAPAPAAGAPASAPAAQRVKNYDFDADLIDGELVKPEGEFLAGRKYAQHGSLIKVRADFIREIVKSAEDL